ncbi:21 kDa protein-like [Melia azedarach]|uniref:21 kDa protein-like n=1 Tax=Melia azedarach TaxID=155640 RepID=A0ACC1X514_MELAZ|nr:21 kDa protein-like [Melia azedarach]
MESRRFAIPCSFLLLTFLLLISNIHTTSAETTATAAKSNSLKIYKKFIKTSCNATTYPSLCYKYLSSYANSIKTDSLNLCKAALVVNLKAAGKTSSLLRSIARKGLHPAEKAVMKDCIEEIDDSVYELKQASNIMGKLKGSDLANQIDDIKTWVSAAITDEETCTDGFDEEEMKIRASVQNQIRKNVVNLGKVTGNTLALIINRFRF